VLWWTHRLLLRWTYPWPHRDGASLGTVEVGPHRGAPTIVAPVGAEAAGAGVPAFPLPLALTLAFAAVVGVGGSRGGAA
jgi:hypothetical protein